MPNNVHDASRAGEFPDSGRQIPRCSCCGELISIYHMCDREEGLWCSDCFDALPCGKGEHGDCCPTTVFDDIADAKLDSLKGGHG